MPSADLPFLAGTIEEIYFRGNVMTKVVRFGIATAVIALADSWRDNAGGWNAVFGCRLVLDSWFLMYFNAGTRAR